MGLGDVGIRVSASPDPDHLFWPHVCVRCSEFVFHSLSSSRLCDRPIHAPQRAHALACISARKPPSSSSSRCGRGASQSYSARVCSLMCVHSVFTTLQALTQKGPSRAGALCTHRIISSKNFPTAVHGEESTAPRLRCLGYFYRGGTFRRQGNCASPSSMSCSKFDICKMYLSYFSTNLLWGFVAFVP